MRNSVCIPSVAPFAAPSLLMIAAHSSAMARALRRVDAAADVAIRLGARVSDAVLFLGSIEVMAGSDWNELAARIEGHLLLVGDTPEVYLVVAPEPNADIDDGEAVLWLKGGGLGVVGRSPTWLATHTLQAAAAFGSFTSSQELGAPFGGSAYHAEPEWSPEGVLKSVRIVVGEEVATAQVATYIRVTQLKLKRLWWGLSMRLGRDTDGLRWSIGIVNERNVRAVQQHLEAHWWSSCWMPYCSAAVVALRWGR